MHKKTKLKNNMKNERFRLPQWTQNEGKRRGKMFGLASPGASENGLEIQSRFFVVLGCLWTLFSAFLASWEPFGQTQGAFSPPSSCLFGSLWKFLGPPGTPRDSAENLPKFSRELAEVPPRSRQEPAKNPPCEPQAKLPFTLRLLRMDCVLR